MEGLAVFITIALLVEAVWESSKMVWQEGLNVDRLGAILLAVFVCVVAKVDLFNYVGVELPLIVGSILTGILCSRGANFIHDLIKKIQPS